MNLRGVHHHLSFGVPDRSALQGWCAHFEAHRVGDTPMTDARSIPGAAVVVFRDPDNIQLELCAEPR